MNSQQIPQVAPDPLPSTTLFADASHPLTEGYHLLAEQLPRDGTFKAWLK
ncbi:MAG: hypothetical protein NTY53_06980 [Kiritimatiellaeota bacterium]|nr:hypothetical protein [Kiritimatiellota bacterium]